MTPPSPAAVLATIYLLLGLCTAVLVARIYLRFKIQKAGLLINDYFMIMAWVTALACSFIDVVLDIKGILRRDLDFSLAGLHAKPEEIEDILKILWAGAIPFFTTFYLCKATLLIIYSKLFPAFMVKRRLALRVIIIYCTMAYITSIFLLLFACYPIKRNWDLSKPDQMCGEDTISLIFQTAWVLHIFGSLCIFILPWLVIYELDMRARTRYSVYGIFLIGLIDIATSITRFLGIQFGNEGGFRSITMVEFWSALDALIGLLVCFLPSLGPYLRPKGITSFECIPDNEVKPSELIPSDPETVRPTRTDKAPCIVDKNS